MQFVVPVLLPTALVASSVAFAQPVITSQPHTQFQWVDKRVSLTLGAVGTPPIAYQWQFNGADILAATNRTFTLPRTQLTDDGSYRVIARDVGGAVTSQVARVMIRSWPEPTGPVVPEFARLETSIRSVMLGHALPGGSLAVVKDDRLVFARGYGFAEVENETPYRPDSICRAGSVSKLITAATVMKSVEQGKLSLDSRVFPLLNMSPPTYPGAVFDPRWTNITLRQTLNHTAGWNEELAINPLGQPGMDPTTWPGAIAADLQLTTTPTPAHLVQWMLGKPLQYPPGTQQIYSNFGSDLAGVVIETLERLPFETLMRDFLAPAGITGIRIAGMTRAERVPGEVLYYVHPELTPDYSSWWEPRPFDFDLPYAWPPSLYAADGGLLISAIDGARFVAAIDGEAGYPDILSSNSVAAMLARPDSPRTSGAFWGLGWAVHSPKWWSKSGSDAGAFTLVMHRPNGASFVFTFNSFDNGTSFNLLYDSIPPILDGVRDWPAHDLFPAALSYEAWRARAFSPAEVARIEISGDNGDPDADGIPNFIEYAHGTDPRVPSLPERPKIETYVGDAGRRYVSLRYHRLLLSHEIEYRLEFSGDLRNWTPLGGDGLGLQLDADGSLMERRLHDASSDSAGFYRLRVIRRGQPN